MFLFQLKYSYTAWYSWFVTAFQGNALSAYSGWLHLDRGPHELNAGTLNIGALPSSETSVKIHCTSRCKTPQEYLLSNTLRENL